MKFQKSRICFFFFLLFWNWSDNAGKHHVLSFENKNGAEFKTSRVIHHHTMYNDSPKTDVMFCILRQHYCFWKEKRCCFVFYSIIASEKKKGVVLKSRDVFDETPMVFFFFQKSTFVIMKTTSRKIENHYGFFFLLISYQLSTQKLVMFLTWLLKNTWCFYRDLLKKKSSFERVFFEETVMV